MHFYAHYEREFAHHRLAIKVSTVRAQSHAWHSGNRMPSQNILADVPHPGGGPERSDSPLHHDTSSSQVSIEDVTDEETIEGRVSPCPSPAGYTVTQPYEDALQVEPLSAALTLSLC